MNLKMRIHHIGYAVKNIEKSVEQFKILGFEKEGSIIYDETRNVNIIFMINENYRIELIESGNREKPSPIDGYLKKKNGVPYHLCYETLDIEKEIERLLANKFILVEEPKEAIAIKNCKVAFLYSGEIGLLELVEIY